MVGKTVDQTKHDRAEVVRQTLLSAGMGDLDLDRMAASVTLPDGSPRFAWTDLRPDHDTYVRIVLDSIGERQRWRAQYEHAKTLVAGVRQSRNRPDQGSSDCSDPSTSHTEELPVMVDRVKRPPVPPLLYRVEEAAEALRLSRTAIYELIRFRHALTSSIAEAPTASGAIGAK